MKLNYILQKANNFSKIGSNQNSVKELGGKNLPGIEKNLLLGCKFLFLLKEIDTEICKY